MFRGGDIITHKKNPQSYVAASTVEVTIAPCILSQEHVFLAQMMIRQPDDSRSSTLHLSLASLAPSRLFFCHEYLPWAPEVDWGWRFSTKLQYRQTYHFFDFFTSVFKVSPYSPLVYDYIMHLFSESPILSNLYHNSAPGTSVLP